MKILQILPSLEVGGVERGVIDIVRALKKAGVESIVVSSGGQLVHELEKMGIPHYTLPVHKKSIFSLALVPQLAALIEREHVDVVHARSRVPAWLAWFAARKAGVPFMTTCHGYYSTHLLSRIMGWGKKVIVISRVIGRHMIDDFKVAPDRIRLIHRGVDLSQFTFRQKTKKKPDDVFKIINVGRFSPIKGQLEFLKAIHQLRSFHAGIEVWLVGSEGKGKTKYTEQIKKTIDQLNLQNCVKILGTRRDIPELLHQADLLVLPTLVPEAFGRVIVEAGAVGTPVIATKIGGVLDIIDDKINGLLVDPADIRGLAAAMRTVIEDPEMAQQFIHRLRTKVETQFSLDQMVQKTREVYEEVREEKKILVFKLGAMGDLILAIPSLRMIKKRFPNSKVTLLVDKKWSSILASCPYLDDLICVDRKRLNQLGYFLRTAKKIRTEGFDCSVDLQNSKWTHLLGVMGGIPERFGFSRGVSGFLINRPDRSAGVAAPPIEHQFRVISKLGVREMESHLELWPEPRALEKMDLMLSSQGWKGSKLIGLVLGASPKWPTKQWPLESFRELAEKILQTLPGYQVVLIGSAFEAGPSSAVFGEDAESGIINCIGKTTLTELVALISRMDLIVSGDTAPLHIAAALQKRIVALFGPTDPKRHMPPVSGAAVLVKNLSCQPCYSGTCKADDKLACLKNISVREVLDAVSRQTAKPANVSSLRTSLKA